LSKNWGIQPSWQPNHCFSTIPIHLKHPMDDFGWSGVGSMSCHSCISLVWVVRSVENSDGKILIFEPEWRHPTSWQPNHCFSTIFIHLIHPMDNFGWSRLGSMSSKSCIAVWFGCWGLWKIQLTNSDFWARIDAANHHERQTIASKPSQFTWYTPWMILGCGQDWDPWAVSLLLQSGLGDEVCRKFSWTNSDFWARIEASNHHESQTIAS
jgi:hypothetical protein